MGSQGKIPGPRARLHREGMGKSQRLIDLCLRGAQGEAACPGTGQPPGGCCLAGNRRERLHVIAHHRTGNRRCWYRVTPCAFVSSQGEIKGSAQAVGWGLWMGKDELHLNLNREAGLLEMGRRRMLALAVAPSRPASGPRLRAGQAGRGAACQA